MKRHQLATRRLAGGRAAGTVPPGVRPSPNIWYHEDVYEIENRAADPDGLLVAAMRRRADFRGADVLDIGCGSGFHTPEFAALVGPGGSVTGVEPHPRLVAAARARLARHDLASRGVGHGPAVRVREGTAQALPLPDRSLDIAHARWAYFFGPGCEPGLAELTRVLRPGGIAFVIDIDATASTHGRWFARDNPRHDDGAIERFWRRRGFARERIAMRWRMTDRADFEAVVRIDFSPTVADAFLASHLGCEVDVAANLWWSRY
ncbi:MAG: class I SAM-dependent methyltransferase [Dermatophilaceae bacterium]